MRVNKVLTIGHSTHDISTFVNMLRQHEITAVADVRSTPMSRFTPQFNQKAVKDSLRNAGIRYVFLGKELGARTENAACYINGQVQYDRLARTVEFASGIERLLKGTRTERIAIMCSEGEPLDCHRTVLVARTLADRNVPIGHIHGDGLIETHAMAMRRLMAKFGLEQADLLHTAAERLEQALRRQEDRIAYVNEDLRTHRAVHG